MRSVCLWLSALITITLVLSLTAKDLSNSASIAATATVVYPIGLLELRDTGEALETPQLTQVGTRSFLYIPHGSPIILIDGTPLDLGENSASQMISMLDITELLANRTSEKPAILTVIDSNK